MYYKKKRVMVLTIISLVIAAGFIYFFLNKDKKVEDTVASCPWTMQSMPNDDPQNRWFGSGVLAIKNAKNDLEAKVGLEDWLSHIKVHRELLIPSYKMFFPSSTGSLDEILVSRAGECASPRTVAMVNEMRLAAANLGTVKLGYAPANGFNTGVEMYGRFYGCLTTIKLV